MKWLVGLQHSPLAQLLAVPGACPGTGKDAVGGQIQMASALPSEQT